MSEQRTFPQIPNEAVEDAAKTLVQKMLEQNQVDGCVGHAHFFMLSDGHSLTTHFIPKALRTEENFEHIRKDINEWIDGEIADLNKGE